MSSSFFYSSPRPRSPSPTRSVLHDLATEEYIQHIREENSRLRSACQALEEGLKTTAFELRRSVDNSPISSPRSTIRSLTFKSPHQEINNLNNSFLSNGDVSVLSDTSTIPATSSPLSNYAGHMRQLCMDTETKLHKLQAQLAASDSEVARRRLDALTFDTRIETLREAFDQKVGELNRTKDLLHVSNDHARELERQLAASPGPLERQAMEAEIGRLRTLLESSRSSENRLRDENRELQMEVMASKRMLEDIRSKPNPSAAMVSEMTRLNAEIKIKDEQLTTMKLQLQDSNIGCTRLRSELESLRGELRNTSVARSTAISAKESELRTLQSLHRDKRSECASLQMELVEAKGKIFLLESELEALKRSRIY